jgi:hypothetical protein
MSRRFQFSLGRLMAATACFAAGAWLAAVAARQQEPLAVGWALPGITIGIGILKGRAMSYGLIATAIALLLLLIMV